MMTCLVAVKTFKKQICFLKTQLLLVWTNRDTYCLHCESLGSGKDAQCDQCWMSLNDGWYHEPAREKNNPKGFVYWLFISHYLAFKCHEMLLTCSYFHIFFRKCDIFSFLIQLFSSSLYLKQIFWRVCVEGDWTSAMFCTGSHGSS